MADTDQVRLSYAEESTFGTHPGGAMTELRYTGEGLKQETETARSSEITSNRTVKDVIRTALNAAGPINFELSYGTFDDFLAAALFSDWSTDSLVNGSTIKSFSLEKEYRDLTNEFAEYLGMMVNEFNLTIEVGSIITGSFGMMGLTEETIASSNGTSYTAANSNQVMNAIDHVTSFSEASSSMEITRFSMQLNNNLRNRMIVTQAGPKDIRPGTIFLTGTLQKYFESATLLDKYLDFGETDFAFVLTDGDGNAYTVTLPKLKLTDGQRVAGGQNGDVIADITWEAYNDPSSGNTIKIDRSAAA